MATHPPAPPPERPPLTPRPVEPSPLRTVLKIVAWGVGALVLLVVVGAGLLVASCGL